MSKNIFTMGPTKKTALTQALYEAGLTPELAIQLAKMNPHARREWMRDMPGRRPRYTYNAAKILGFRYISRFDFPAFPDAEPGEMVIFYGGWSCMDLYNNALIVKESLMHWHCQLDTRQLEGRIRSGIYRLRLEVFGRKDGSGTYDLLEGEKRVPTCLALTALLAHYIESGKWLIDKGYHINCEEPTGSVSIEREQFNRLLIRSSGGGGMSMGYRLLIPEPHKD